jgi:hypothetical protein
MSRRRCSGAKMWFQQQTRVKLFGAAAIAALVLCSIAAFAASMSSSSSVQFSSQTVGTTSAPMPVKITNTSNRAITIQGASISVAQFSFVGPVFPVTVAVGQSLTGSVTFTPSAAQSYSGTLTFTHSNGPRVTVSLSGTGVSSTSPALAALIAAPSAMAFSAQAGGANPATQSLTIGENPAGALTFSVSADQAWMTLSAASGTTSSAIQVGANISGLAAGNYTGHVLISEAGVTNSPLSVTVTLAITAPPTYTLSVSPTSVAFGNINLGNNNTKSVTVTNSGTGSVTISQVSVVGAGLSANGITAPMLLSAGQTTVLSIVFAPTTVGSVSGTVSVVSDATNSPAMIAATGAGVQASLSASPSALNFGNVNVGSVGTQTVKLSNNGTAAASISQAAISGSGYTVSGLTLPMSLAVGASSSFAVQFTPTVAGTVSGGVTVTSNTPNSPTLVGLSGTGAAAVSHSVSLTWNASTSVVVGYNIYRGGVSGGPYALLNSTPNTSLSYTDGSVLSGQTYYYVVTAVDATGAESVVSNEVQVIIP